ncbi:hypothetical protein LXL04_011109 [Taraxacum kok-saghyz]
MPTFSYIIKGVGTFYSTAHLLFSTDFQFLPHTSKYNGSSPHLDLGSFLFTPSPNRELQTPSPTTDSIPASFLSCLRPPTLHPTSSSGACSSPHRELGSFKLYHQRPIPSQRASCPVSGHQLFTPPRARELPLQPIANSGASKPFTARRSVSFVYRLIHYHHLPIFPIKFIIGLFVALERK